MLAQRLSFGGSSVVAHQQTETGSVDAQLVLAALQSIQLEMSSMRSTLENVEGTSTNNAARLQTIEGLLRSSVAAAKSSGVQEPHGHEASAARQKLTHAIALAAFASSILLLSPRLRRTLQRALKRTPVSVLALAQVSTSAVLLFCRGTDLLNEFLRGSAGASTSEPLSARRRQICYYLLLASSAALPAKGVAHLLPDARVRRR